MRRLGASSGHWFKVSSATGAVITSGTNGLPMYDLSALAVPEPATMSLLVLGGLALIRRRKP